MLAMSHRRAMVALAVLIVLVLVASAFAGVGSAAPVAPSPAAVPAVVPTAPPIALAPAPASNAPSTVTSSPATPVAGAALTQTHPDTNFRYIAPSQLPAAGPHPAQVPCIAGTNLLAYTTTTGGANGTTFWPLMPAVSGQAPCKIDWYSAVYGQIGPFNDEIHLTYSSAVPGSGSRWSIPLHLPTDGSQPGFGGIQDFVNDVYAGMVVTGDNRSLDNQSYLQVVFTPGTPDGNYANLTWNVSLSVLSFHVGTNTSGVCEPPYGGLTVDWNNLVACELEVLGGGAGVRLASYVPANSFYNVTFNGASSNGITVYANDSSSSKKAYSASYTLDKANTVNYTFTPMYSSSCEDLCYLNWSMPFGNGFGADMCIYNFNITLQDVINPIEVGAAQYFTEGGYSGDFSNISIESASGGCGGLEYTIDCGPLLSQQGTQYPYFQFNGTVMALGNGQDYPWTTEDFNQYYQFESHGNPNDTVPLWLDELTNSSQAGFIAPGNPLVVTVRAQDLGSVSQVLLNYTAPDGTRGSLNMSRSSGTRSDGMYKATIPGSSTKGLLVYYIAVTNHAGEVVRLPSLHGTYFSVQNGPIPKFNVDILTTPASCGSVILNGTTYINHQTATLSAGYYSASAVPCYPYIFSHWTPTGVAVNNTRVSPITVELKENGTLVVVWKYIRPFDTLLVEIATDHCGALILNGTTYTSNQTVHLLDALKVPLSYAACAGNTFSGWVVAIPANITVLGGNPDTFLTLHGNGSIVLTYIPSPRALALVLQTGPPGCGGVLFRGAGYTNNLSIGVLQSVAYPIAPDPCAHYGLLNWSTTAGLVITGSAAVGWNLTVSAPGTLKAIYYHLTEVTIETLPGYCGDIQWNSVTYFNGTTLIVQNGSTFTAFAQPCSGYYFSGFYTTGGVTARGNAVTVVGSGILEAVFDPGRPTDFVAFITDPGNCGQISFGGLNYSGAAYAHVDLNTSANLIAYPCANYGFVGWEVGGVGITITGPHAQNTHVYVNGSGSITAHFHPLAPLFLYTTPTTCGSITVNGVPYSDGAQVALPAPNTYTISVNACPHYGFLYWLPSSGIAVANGTLAMSSAARLTAVFGPLTYQVRLDVAPGDCGGVKLGGNQYVNNTTVAEPYGTYSIGPTPCSGFHLVSWTVTGGVTITTLANGHYQMTVADSGSVLGMYLPVPPVATLAAPSSTAIGGSIALAVVIGTLVPPYNYTYIWTFGDGATATTAANFTTHSYASIGTYQVSVKVIDPYGRVAYANQTVQVLTSPPGSNTSLTLTAALAVVIGVVAVAAAVLLALRGGRVPPEAGERAGAEATPETSTPTEEKSIRKTEP
jgi:hypothetical protein